MGADVQGDLEGKWVGGWVEGKRRYELAIAIGSDPFIHPPTHPLLTYLVEQAGKARGGVGGSPIQRLALGVGAEETTLQPSSSSSSSCSRSSRGFVVHAGKGRLLFLSGWVGG